MTRKELESVYYLKKELNMWQTRLAELQADIALSPKVLDGMPFQHTNSVSNPTAAKAERLAELGKVIDGKISELQWTIAEIELFIMEINDTEMRQIIEHRCVHCKSWENIGELLGYDRTTISKKYNAFINSTFPQFPLAM